MLFEVHVCREFRLKQELSAPPSSSPPSSSSSSLIFMWIYYVTGSELVFKPRTLYFVVEFMSVQPVSRMHVQVQSVQYIMYPCYNHCMGIFLYISLEHDNCCKTNIGETSERRGRAYWGFPARFLSLSLYLSLSLSIYIYISSHTFFAVKNTVVL